MRRGGGDHVNPEYVGGLGGGGGEGTVFVLLSHQQNSLKAVPGKLLRIILIHDNIRAVLHVFV